MRINKFIASSTRLSRRAADKAIETGRVLVNDLPPQPGQDITEQDVVTLDKRPVALLEVTQTIIFNKPTGVVVSREGQGNKTIYDILPSELQHLNPIGRLDKYSSGLLLLTSDGELAHKLTHPSFEKTKIYEIGLNKPLTEADFHTITGKGVPLEDGPSKLGLVRQGNHNDNKRWRVSMHEGRNRQIRRTFETLGYTVTKLDRTSFGDYKLPLNLARGAYQEV